jgi:hypothetical protein
VDCPALADEARAVLEARAQAELLSETLPSGNVSITCDASSATLRWTPADGAPRERRVALVRGAESDDAVLAAVHALLFEDGRVAPAPAPVEAPSVPPLETRPRAPAPGSSPVRFAGIAGGDVELWSGSVRVALGAETGVAITSGRWACRILAAPQWGLGAPRGIRAWALRGEVLVVYSPLPYLDVAVGADVRSVWANATGTTTAQQQAASGGALLSARGTMHLGPIALSLGPRVEAMVRPVLVELAGTELFRVPSVVAGATLDGMAP